MQVTIQRDGVTLATLPVECFNTSARGLRRLAASVLPRHQWRTMLRAGRTGLLSRVWSLEGSTLAVVMVGDTHPITFYAPAMRRDGEWKAAHTHLSPGHVAYEQELSYIPNYHDGAKRHAWGELQAAVQDNWNRYPSPRRPYAVRL